MPEGPVPAGSPTRQPRWGANAGSKQRERASVRSASSCGEHLTAPSTAIASNG
jgi:hypothetical protein